jgi:hypothetical protein
MTKKTRKPCPETKKAFYSQREENAFLVFTQ